jgi:tetratricopeptide (TPR) repeat protein
VSTTPTNTTPGESKRSSNSNGAPPLPVHNPDQIQKTLLDGVSWVQRNMKVLVAVGVVFVIAAVAHIVAHSFWDYQERKAQEAYYAAESKFTKLKEGFDRAKLQAMMPAGMGQSQATDKPATGNLEADFGALITEFEKVAREQAGTAAGAQAAIVAAETYLEYNQPEKAAEVAGIAVQKLNKKHLLNHLARIQLGSALAAKGDCQGAVTEWEKVLSNKQAAFLHAEAGLRSGMCFESMNQPEKAAEMYRKVTADNADSTAAGTAKGLLRAIEVKAKQGPPTQG